jgi:F5/8 type C domain
LQEEALGISGGGFDYRMGAPAEKIWRKKSCVGSQFQITFPQMYLIKAILLAGHPNFPNNVVEQFKIMFSKSGSEENLRWYGTSMDTPDPPDQDQPRGFNGPENGATPILITFDYPWTARLVRLVLQEASASPCFLRLEFFGRPLPDGCMMPLGMQSGEIADFQLNSSSQYFPPNSNTSYGPERARYDARTDSRGYGAWRPDPNDKDRWISVNFRRKVQINAIILQSYELSFVETFALMQSEDDDIWRDYKVLSRPHLMTYFLQLDPTNWNQRFIHIQSINARVQWFSELVEQTMLLPVHEGGGAEPS